MSSTVRSFGFIVVLAKALTKKARNALSEKLWDDKSNLELNYEGTLLIWDENRNKGLSVREEIYHLTIGEELVPTEMFAEARKYPKLAFVGHTIRSFDCIWYSGGDSPVSELTLEKFLVRTKQV